MRDWNTIKLIRCSACECVSLMTESDIAAVKRTKKAGEFTVNRNDEGTKLRFRTTPKCADCFFKPKLTKYVKQVGTIPPAFIGLR